MQIVDGATLTAIASDQTTLAITGSAPEDNPEVWTSADGQTWEPVDAISSQAGALEDIAATTQGRNHTRLVRRPPRHDQHLI